MIPAATQGHRAKVLVLHEKYGLIQQLRYAKKLQKRMYGK